MPLAARLVPLPLAIFAVCLAVSAGARADEVADFYRGKQVQVVVGNGPGGGYDIYARLLARHIGKYIAGNPTAVVQNMPGAGGLRAANYLYSVAPKDGTVLGLLARDLPLLGIIGSASNVQFDPRKYTWLGSSSSYSSDAYLLMLRKDAAVKSIEDARRPGGPPMVLGTTAEGASSNDVSALLREALGLHIRQVLGYRDSGALYIAIDQNELEGRTAGLSSVRATHPQWLAPDSNMRVLLQFARITRHPDFPDVPTARELAVTESARALIELAELPYFLSRPFAAPPGLPPARAKALQAAFLAAHQDAQYIEEARRLGVEVSPIGGEQVLHAVEGMAATPPDLRATLKKLLAPSNVQKSDKE